MCNSISLISYRDVISKFNDTIFIIHVTGESHKLHQEVLLDEGHDGAEDEGEEEVNVDDVPGAMELPTKNKRFTGLNAHLNIKRLHRRLKPIYKHDR